MTRESVAPYNIAVVDGEVQIRFYIELVELTEEEDV